ncbi:MAG: hypothetical protein KGQ41_08415 [Alphaproteobacteria bacterium]|nr:hypothetical protein [Alphaproteobacteria bacterium]
MLRIIALLLCLLAPAASWAQEASAPAHKTSVPQLLLKEYEASHPEKMILAFNKVAGQQPDFLEWAKHSPFLEGAKNSDKDAIISRETNRLQQAYASLDITQPLIVRAKINLDEYSTMQEMLTLNEFTPKTFFSYNIYGQKVAVIPQDIAKFHTIKLGSAEMEEILSKAGSNQVIAELLLKPAVADAKAPFVVEGTPYWLLLAQICEIRFWAKKEDKGELVWFYRADWYKPEADKALMDLKSGGF